MPTSLLVRGLHWTEINVYDKLLPFPLANSWRCSPCPLRRRFTFPTHPLFPLANARTCSKDGSVRNRQVVVEEGLRRLSGTHPRFSTNQTDRTVCQNTRSVMRTCVRGMDYPHRGGRGVKQKNAHVDARVDAPVNDVQSTGNETLANSRNGFDPHPVTQLVIGSGTSVGS